jgi:hypothetical protein
MRNKNLNARHQQRKKAQRGGPMRDADKSRMPHGLNA